MGTIIKVEGADYSANAIAKYDIELDVIRQFRADGTPEKNAWKAAPPRQLQASHNIDAFVGKDLTFKVNFKPKIRGTGGRESILTFFANDMKFQLTYDHTNNRLEARIGKPVALKEEVWLLNNIDTIFVRDSTIDAITNRLVGTDAKIVVNLKHTPSGYLIYTLKDLYINGVRYNPSRAETSTIPVPYSQAIYLNGDRWNNIGSTLGEFGYNHIWFVGLVNSDGIPLIHLDFIGNTNVEMWTDKTGAFVLEAGGLALNVGDKYMIEVGD